MTYTVTTNHHWRDVVYAHELPAGVLAEEFDYIDVASIERGEIDPTFVQYRGEWYDLSDVLLAPDSIRELGWDGFNSDTYFSGVAFKFSEDGEHVKVARIYSD